jgi:signal transduction histidine kinase
MLFEEMKRAEVYPELLSMFTNGLAQAAWPSKVKTELFTLAKEIYNRTADLNIQLEPAEIKINPEYLQRMVLELADNALKFSKAGDKVQVYGRRDNDDYIIEVIDKGRGFAIESLDHIAPFKQFNRSKFEQQGLGIGLYLVKRIVDFNQGEMKIISLEGEGTRIVVSIPVAQEEVYQNNAYALQEA